MRRIVTYVALAGIAALCGLPGSPAQQAGSAADAAFDTASIHPSKMSPGCFSMLPPGGTQYAVTCLPLRNLIAIAYRTGYIDGGGKGLDTLYDVRASTGETPWTGESIRPMMRQLLTQRFHLAVHESTRDVSGYRLVIAKGGPTLQSVSGDSMPKGQKAGEPSANFIMPGRVQGRGVNAQSIAGLLSVAARAPVSDETGLKGLFNMDLRYSPDNSADSDLPPFFAAVEEQLGLKLQPGKITVHTVVIDHVDAEPTPN